MALRRDEYGFVRSSSYGRTQQSDLRSELGAMPDDQVYRSSVRNGVRTSSPVYESDVNLQPGDTFALGPKVTKAAVSNQLLREWHALQRGGYGQIDPPIETAWGFCIQLNNFTLPGGVRTSAMVLLPRDYPIVPPLGFYIDRSGVDAVRALGIDTRHLFPDKTFYGAPNFAQHGWAWFCLKFEPWRPNHHTLISIIMMVAAIITEGVRK
jgi:hypothetical protein